MNLQQRTGTSDSQDGVHDLYLPENELTGKVPSAPPLALGTAVLHVRVRWPEGHIPRKDFALRKALQTWLRKDLGSSVEIESLQLDDATDWAKVEIYPSTSLDIVLDQQFAQLKLKDSRIITLDFHRDVSVKEPEQAAPEADTSTPEIILQVAPTVATNGKGSVSQNTHSNANQEIGVPLAHYWYMNQVHRQEMERLQSKYKVKVQSDVFVRIEADDATSDSVTNACKEFANLFQRCTNDLEIISLPGVHQDSGIMTDFMKYILREERKLMLNMSGQHLSLFGPEKNITTVQAMLDMKTKMGKPSMTKGAKPKASKDLNKESKGNLQREAPMPNASGQNLRGHVKTTIGYFTSERPIRNVLKEVNLDGLKDPLLTDEILMSHTHWEIMRGTFKIQIENIQTKFGVAVQESWLKDEVKVRVVGNHPHSLEVNGIRALMSLYQKVVTSTTCCPLQNVSHSQAEMVKLYLRDIREQNPSLVVREGTATNGVWMMIGLPDHLHFAVREIEKKLGGPVFDEKHKHMIGYDQATEFLSNMPAKDGVKKKETEAASGGATYEDIEERRRTDRGIPRGTEREIAHGHDGGISQGQVLGNEASKGGNVSGWNKEAFFKVDQTGLYGRGTAWEPGISKAYKAQDVWGKEAALPYSDGKTFSGGSGAEYNCPICMDEFKNKERLSCGHDFCKDCLRRSVASLGPNCPLCRKVFQKVEGDQPDGTMTYLLKKSTLPGFKRCDTFIITYHIPSGIQSMNHPNPGKPFKGAHLTAYLPAIREGKEVLELLRKAFDRRLVFTVGTSPTGGDDSVIWNGIHHKTSTHGGPQGAGYPDDNYLKRVREELKAKGIE